MVAEQMTALGEVRIRDLVAGTPEFRKVVLEMVSAVVEIDAQQPEFTDHLLRRVFTDGLGCKYDPGDEPAMTIVGPFVRM